MDRSPDVEIWEYGQDRAAAAHPAAGGGEAATPDFRGIIVGDHGALLEVRVLGGAPLPAAPETVYLVGGRGLYQVLKRIDWLGASSGIPQALLLMTAV